MSDIPPIAIPPDEGEREMIRSLIAEADAAGKPERVFRIVEEALYDSWAKIDALRAAQGAQRPQEEGVA